MSLDLDVKITKSIESKHMLTNCHIELAKLSNFKDIPQLEMFQLKNGFRSQVSDDHILAPGESFIIKFNNVAEEISFIITEINLLLPYIDEDDSGTWGGISIQGEDESKFLLAAGIAAYLSNYCNSIIIDERCFWTIYRECDYNKFIDSIKIKSSISNMNFDILCNKFYEMLPKGE